jgi:hypothetical protein
MAKLIHTEGGRGKDSTRAARVEIQNLMTALTAKAATIEEGRGNGNGTGLAKTNTAPMAKAATIEEAKESADGRASLPPAKTSTILRMMTIISIHIPGVIKGRPAPLSKSPIQMPPSTCGFFIRWQPSSLGPNPIPLSIARPVG